ncbi:MAG: hypothetical protein LBR27_04290 [Bifidobacteriaceae bacterium]|jgi:hypothetical protein|nr:hypothetical protein [Bifidobacteriaceae bacterium]
MANTTRASRRHIANIILGGFTAALLGLGITLQLTGPAEAEDPDQTGQAASASQVDQAALAADWNDHPQTDHSGEAVSGSNSTTTAHVMLYQAGHKPSEAAAAPTLGTTRHDSVNETDDYGKGTWSSTGHSSHIKRYDSVTIDVTNTGTGVMAFEVWEDVKGWGDYWCLWKGDWSSAGPCDTVYVNPGETFTATVQPNQHQGPWPHYSVAGIYLAYWDSTPAPTPPNHHTVTDHLSDGSTLVTQFNLTDEAQWYYKCDDHEVSASTTDPAYDQSVIQMADAFEANGYLVSGDSPDSLGLVIDVTAKGTFTCG